MTGDRWTLASTPRGRDRWHLFRAAPSTSGGTYGWERLCAAHVLGPYAGPRAGQEPPPSAPVCRECRRRRAGLARWEETPQAGDWLSQIVSPAESPKSPTSP